MNGASTSDLEFEREVTRRRLGEQQAAEAELTAAISRTETLLSGLRANLNEARKKREQYRARIEEANRKLRGRGRG